MEILTTRNFNGVALDCYKGNDNNDFWATREQIGQLLGYSHPRQMYFHSYPITVNIPARPYLGVTQADL